MSGCSIGFVSPPGTAQSLPVLPVYSDGFSYVASPPGYGVATSRNGSPLHEDGSRTKSGCTACPDPSYVTTGRACTFEGGCASAYALACAVAPPSAAALSMCVPVDVSRRHRARPLPFASVVPDSGVITSPAPLS